MSERGEVRRYFEQVVLTYEGDDCLIWPYASTETGYGRMKVAGRCRVVPRLVCETIHGAPPTSEHQAAHSCGNGHLGCVTANHLSWKTPFENTQDAIAHGTVEAKLDEHKVRALRSRGPNGPSMAELAKTYGCCKATISFAINGRNWAWVDADAHSDEAAA